MSTIVLVTAELCPYHLLGGTMVTDAVVALNAELRAFFADKVTVDPPIPTDRSNLVYSDKIFSEDVAREGQVWTQGTVALGFKLDDLEEARQLAETFTSPVFTQVMVDILDPAVPIEPSDTSNPFVPPSVQLQIAEQLVKYGSAEEREARKAAES